MVVFSDKQIKILRGNQGTIANITGCSLQYVMAVIKGRRGQNTELAKRIVEKCQELLNVLEK